MPVADTLIGLSPVPDIPPTRIVTFKFTNDCCIYPVIDVGDRMGSLEVVRTYIAARLLVR